MTSPLVEARGVAHRFGSRTALHDASLQVGGGEIVGLLGANGAGKTTLIRILLGLLTPSAGTVGLFGEAPSRRGRNRLGYVPQGLGLYGDLTVDENARFVANAFGVPADDVALPAELEPLRRTLVARIGLGRQRQLAFACALAHRPELLVLDEPTSGVSPLARARLWDRIHEQAERGVGVLVTTHHLQEAQQCDRLVLLAEGRVTATGTLADVLAGHVAAEVTNTRWAEAFGALRAAGLPVGLAGTRVRVADTSVARVRAVLAAAGVAADVVERPATLEEALAVLGRAGAGAPSTGASPASGPRPARWPGAG